MQRNTYAGHGKPELFVYGGRGKEPTGRITLTWDALKASEPDVTGNTKFWAEVPGGGEPTSDGVVKGLRATADRLEAELAEAKELATGLESKVNALEAELAVERGDRAVAVEGTVEDGPAVEFVSIPVEVLDALLDEMEEAGKAAQREVVRLKTARASSGDRRKLAFHSGVAKTLAYFLPKFDKLTEG